MNTLETLTHTDAEPLSLFFRRAPSPARGDRCPHPKVDEGEGEGALWRKSRRCVHVMQEDEKLWLYMNTLV